ATRHLTQRAGINIPNIQESTEGVNTQHFKCVKPTKNNDKVDPIKGGNYKAAGADRSLCLSDINISPYTHTARGYLQWKHTISPFYLDNNSVKTFSSFYAPLSPKGQKRIGHNPNTPTAYFGQPTYAAARHWTKLTRTNNGRTFVRDNTTKNEIFLDTGHN
ncbi:unnamed protein product, partial [Ectocarpus sp. 4 AP-2014]